MAQIMDLRFPVRIVSQMVTVPILGMDLYPRDPNFTPLVEMKPLLLMLPFLAELLQTALLFKWKYFLTKSHGVSLDLRISSVLIGCYSGHMTKNETLRDFRLNETLQK